MLLLPSLALVFACLQTGVSTPQAGAPVAFKLDASDVFEFFTDQAQLGFVGGLLGAEGLASAKGLTKLAGSDFQGASLRRWQGTNSSGTVFVQVAIPHLFDRSINQFVVQYFPATEARMSEALLSHLLSKAEATNIVSGDELLLKFPQQPTGQKVADCSEWRTIRIRLSTGALVTNRAEYLCAAKK